MFALVTDGVGIPIENGSIQGASLTMASLLITALPQSENRLFLVPQSLLTTTISFNKMPVEDVKIR